MNIFTTQQLLALIDANITINQLDYTRDDMLEHMFGDYTAMTPNKLRILDESEAIYQKITAQQDNLKGAAIVEATHAWTTEDMNDYEEEYAGQNTYWIYTKEYGFEEPIDFYDRTDFTTATVVAAKLEGIERGDDYNSVSPDCYGAHEEIEYITLTFDNGDTAKLSARALMTALGYNMSEYNKFDYTEDDNTPRILYSKDYYTASMHLHGGSKFGYILSGNIDNDVEHYSERYAERMLEENGDYNKDEDDRYNDYELSDEEYRDCIDTVAGYFTDLMEEIEEVFIDWEVDYSDGEVIAIRLPAKKVANA